MVTFKSIAVLDTETTSLPQNDHNTTKIIELALLGCEIDHVKHSKKLPRVLHKLVLLFNPKKLVYPGATYASGLSNELLMNIKPFTEDDAEALTYFINRLPSPVCIVAHNGDNFDFPILRRALKKVNKNLPENVYCADSIKAFMELLPKSVNSNYASHSCVHAMNETTPKHQKTQPVNRMPFKNTARQLFQDEAEVLLDDQNKFPNNYEFNEWAFSQDRAMSYKAAINHPKSYRLRDIYYFFFNRYFVDSHRAEEDSKALLNCIIHCEKFWEWISKNAVTFNSIEPLF